MPDWGVGRYEVIAEELQPVAERVVAMANPLRGEKVLDIACGTGNAAILAARFRADVTGLDQAPRLIGVARHRAEAEGLKASFTVGDAEDLPLPDASFDVVLSIFGLIFAPDGKKAFGELVRVLCPGGRAFFTVWLPGGAIDHMVQVFSEAMNRATGGAGGPAMFEWHDGDRIRALAEENRVDVRFHDGELQFAGTSPEDYFKRKMENDPMSLAMRPVLEGAGLFEEVARQATEVLREGNEDAAGFQVTSRFRIVEVRR